MSDPNYDGLCGVASPFCTHDGRRLRCSLHMMHTHDHSWEKYRYHFMFGSNSPRNRLGHATYCKQTE